MRMLHFIVAASTLALGACATVPKPLEGPYANTQPAAAGHDGERVRWGGEIIRVDTTADRSCFEILGRELDDSARPRRRDESAGRFLACRSGFYDPEVFTKGREVTVTGTLAGSEERKVGEYEYRYPRVDADVIYLWQQRVARPYYYDPYPFGPFGPYGGYGFGWDPFWYRPFGPPVVIVRPHPHPHPHPRGK